MSNVVRLRQPNRMFSPMALMDSFQSFLSGLGIFGRDKGVTTTASLHVLSQRDLQNMYRSDWLSRKICDIPAFDACRAWRAWTGTQDQIEALQAAERRFGLQRKLMGAISRARLYGGAAVIIGVTEGGRNASDTPQDARWRDEVITQQRKLMKDAGAQQTAIDYATTNIGPQNFLKALDVDKVKKGDLKFVHVVERWMIAAGPRVLDITSPWFGEPNYYMRANQPILPAPGGVDPLPGGVNWSADPSATIYIHPSRVVRLIGNEYPDIEQAPDSWGDSVLQTVYEAVKDANTVSQSVANLTSRANVNVIQVPGLTNNLATADGTAAVTNRFANVNAAQSVVNSILIDKDEDWKQMQVSFSGLPQVLQMYLMIASGAADIPATRLLGREPAGENATGESDLRNYYDRLSAEQEVKYKPLLSPLDEVLIRDTFGTRDPSLGYNWNPLWQLTPEQKADVYFKKSQGHKIDVDAGLIPAAVLAEARESQLIEDGVYPGLEMALEEYQAQLDEENVDEDEMDGDAGDKDKDGLDADEDEDETPTEDEPDNPDAKPVKDDSPFQSSLSFRVPNGGGRNWRGKKKKRPFKIRKPALDAKDPQGHGSDPHGGESRRQRLARYQKMYNKAMKWAAKHNKGGAHKVHAGAYENLVAPGLGLEVGYGDSDIGIATAPLYVYRPILNADSIIQFYKAQGLPTTIPANDMHVTVAYSRQPVDWMKFSPNVDQILVYKSNDRSTQRFGDNGEALVLSFNDADLAGRNQAFSDGGAVWDWTSYRPHITISYNAPADMTLVPYTGPILLGPEEFDLAGEDWEAVEDKRMVGGLV